MGWVLGPHTRISLLPPEIYTGLGLKLSVHDLSGGIDCSSLRVPTIPGKSRVEASE